MANPGNLGDALIRQGTIRFFKDIGLVYEEITRPPKEATGTFIFGGGGAWCANWNHSHFVNASVPKAKQVIVLPSTYAVRSPLFNIPKIHFFARDNRDSLLYCPDATYHQDMAFHLAPALKPQEGDGVGHFMRTDKESARHFKIPKGNRDISVWGETYHNTSPFIEAINKVREVHTDRLHVAIVACMLGKRVVFYGGNYFKNKAIYLSRMKGQFDVTFREHDRGQPSHGEATSSNR
jgi:exopolysaccharide biosynthesis predicted pyruvyltransferase EpsI